MARGSCDKKVPLAAFKEDRSLSVAPDVRSAVSRSSDIMEAELEDAARKILANKKIEGVICADPQGLCLLARGTAASASAGNIVSLAERAKALHPELDPPTIAINYTTMDVVVQKKDGFTMGIIKKKA